MQMRALFCTLCCILLTFTICYGFKPVVRHVRPLKTSLFMGRAAAVRAATKSRTDAAKAKNNGRYAKKIIMAVKAGGPDPDINRQLASVISDAKSANVPKDIIARNIEKASAATTMDFKESLFEFYGHGGVGLLVRVLTDNDNRAAADVNLVAKKNSLKTAASNSVAFKFEKKQRLDVGKVIDEDTLMEICLECGVDDYQLRTDIDGCVSSPMEENTSVIYVDLKNMAALRDALTAKGYDISARLMSIPLEGYTALEDADFEANMAAIDAFDALDDVDLVEHNIDMKGDDSE